MSKVIIVIGGTGGIGFAICKMLFKKGLTVYLIGRDRKQALRKAKIIERSGKKVLSAAADVLNEKKLAGLFKKIQEKHKKIDAVINLAGIFEPFGEFEKVPLNKHIRTIEVNLVGSFNVIHKILPIFKKQGFGKIILFSGGGVGGDTPLTNASSYFTSKGAISILTEVLGKELETYNIQINSVLPGQILTKSTKKTFKISKKKLGPILGPATQYLKETGGNSKDAVLRMVDFLISEESNHITGRSLSAKWDNIKTLKNKIGDENFKLRRIDGRLYKKVNRLG